MGPLVHVSSANIKNGALCVFLNSAIPIASLEILAGGGDKSAGAAAAHYLPAYIENIPAPDPAVWASLEDAFTIVHSYVSDENSDESSPRFVRPDFATEGYLQRNNAARDALSFWGSIQLQIGDAFGIDEQSLDSIARGVGQLTPGLLREGLERAVSSLKCNGTG
jgi:hypothetical protein